MNSNNRIAASLYSLGT